MLLPPNSVTALSSERIVWVDIVRAAAILLIICFHVAYEFTLDPNIRYVGYLGDSLFFIVSGYMLAQHYPKLKSFDLSWLWKRYVKVASLYYLTLIAIAILFFSSQGWLALGYDLLLHFTFMNWAVPGYLYTIISPAWFVIPLAAYYLLFPYLNRLLSWSKYALVLIFVLTLAYRYYEGSWASPNPLFFLGDFCFGIVFAQDRKSLPLVSPLITVVLSPIMLIPYIAFYIISLLEFFPKLMPAALGTLFTIIGSYTYELFLFHESIMKTMLGKWSIFGLAAAPSLAVLLIVLATVDHASRLIQRLLIPAANG